MKPTEAAACKHAAWIPTGVSWQCPLEQRGRTEALKPWGHFSVDGSRVTCESYFNLQVWSCNKSCLSQPTALTSLSLSLSISAGPGYKCHLGHIYIHKWTRLTSGNKKHLFICHWPLVFNSLELIAWNKKVRWNKCKDTNYMLKKGWMSPLVDRKERNAPCSFFLCEDRVCMK